jgi:hypothetical protein
MPGKAAFRSDVEPKNENDLLVNTDLRSDCLSGTGRCLGAAMWQNCSLWACLDEVLKREFESSQAIADMRYRCALRRCNGKRISAKSKDANCQYCIANLVICSISFPLTLHFPEFAIAKLQIRWRKKTCCPWRKLTPNIFSWSKCAFGVSFRPERYPTAYTVHQTPASTLEELVPADQSLGLVNAYGRFMTTEEVVAELRYPSQTAFRNAVRRGTLGLKSVRMPGRKGCLFVTAQVEQLLRELIQAAQEGDTPM